MGESSRSFPHLGHPKVCSPDERWKANAPEERKERNRQHAVAPRDRGTEYIKQLEDTAQQRNGKLESLQQTLEKIVDESLTLRYKNLFLERILTKSGKDLDPSTF